MVTPINQDQINKEEMDYAEEFKIYEAERHQRASWLKLLKLVKSIFSDFKDSFTPYSSWRPVLKDLMQPFEGVWNIYVGALLLMLVFFSSLILYLADTRFRDFSYLEVVGYCIILHTLEILRGCVQLLTVPLTYLLKMPLRGIISLVSNGNDASQIKKDRTITEGLKSKVIEPEATLHLETYEEEKVAVPRDSISHILSFLDAKEQVKTGLVSTDFYMAQRNNLEQGEKGPDYWVVGEFLVHMPSHEKRLWHRDHVKYEEILTHSIFRKNVVRIFKTEEDARFYAISLTQCTDYDWSMPPIYKVKYLRDDITEGAKSRVVDITVHPGTTSSIHDVFHAIQHGLFVPESNEIFASPDELMERTKSLEFYVRSRNDIKIIEGKPAALFSSHNYQLDKDTNEYQLVITPTN